MDGSISIASAPRTPFVDRCEFTPGGGHVQFDAYELIRPVVLTGYSSETLAGRHFVLQ
jgi:hypothetical protein